MALLLHLSDTHFGTEQPEVVDALLRLAEALRPQVAVLSGDVTQRARASQFTAAHAFMQALCAEVKLVIPGNHDVPLFNLWARCCHPYAGFERVFGPERSPVYESPEFLVICVDTTRPWRHQAGVVSPQQVERVVQRLRASVAGQLKVVVVHQPLAIVTPEDLKNRLHGHAHAARAWARAGVHLVLGGHIHLPYVVQLDVPGSVLAWVVQAGTAVSHRLRGGVPNSVNVIDWTGGAGRQGVCGLAQYNYLSGPRRFVQVGQRRVLAGLHLPP